MYCKAYKLTFAIIYKSIASLLRNTKSKVLLFETDLTAS